MSGSLNPALGTGFVSATGGLSRILDGIEGALPGVPDTMVQLCVWDALEEFCVRSTYWRMTVAWSLAPGVSRVDLNPIDDIALVSTVLRVCPRGTNAPRWRLAPQATLVDTGDDYSTVRSGTARVVCKPRRLDDLVVPTFLLNDWSEALRNGALSRLFAQHLKPWSNPSMAEYHGKRFRDQIRLARDEQRFRNDRTAAFFPYFAGGRLRGVGDPSFFYTANGSCDACGDVDPLVLLNAFTAGDPMTTSLTPFPLTNSVSGTMGTLTTVVVPYSATRRWLQFTNRSSGVETQDLGSANVTVGGGIPLAPNQGYLFNAGGATGPIYGVTTVANSPWSYVEG